MNLRFAISSLLVGASIAGVYACGSSTAASEAASGNCPDVGTKACPNDDAITQDDVDQCNKALASSCGSQYKSLLECAGNNVSCGSDGKSGTSASTACASQSTDYTACIIGGSTNDAGTVTIGTTDASSTTGTTDAS